MNKATNRTLRAVSLFSNCGAGDVGFAKAGFSFGVMAEIQARRLDIALLNHAGAIGIEGDLRETLPAVVRAYRQAANSEPPALIAACPPCQGMSSARGARGLELDADAGSRDERNLLVSVIIEAVERLKPRAVVVENVQAFLNRLVRHPTTRTPVSAATYLVDALASDYVAYPLIADLADYGVPQWRKRAFITLLRKNEPAVRDLDRVGRVPFPRPSRAGRRGRITVSTALTSYRLPPLDAASADRAKSEWAMHFVPVLPPRLYRMVEAIPAGSGRSAWQNDRCLGCGALVSDLTLARCFNCREILPRPTVVEEDGTARLVTGFHNSSYRRMPLNEPAATITTASGRLGSDRNIHPTENRVMSPLECALLQTFPRTFDWGNGLKRWGHTALREMIGEAVPPLFTRKHGDTLVALLGGTIPNNLLRIDDRRVVAAQRAIGRARTAL